MNHASPCVPAGGGFFCPFAALMPAHLVPVLKNLLTENRKKAKITLNSPRQSISEPDPS
jgi:hypothetical protein